MSHFRSLLLTLPLAFGVAPALAAEQPLVLELFTSQSCSSCPPAEAVLQSLTSRADLLPLAMHVTYWDRLGWKDPYSLPAATDRQRRYAGTFGADNIYTPQLVVGGARQVVGSDRRAVAAAIAATDADRARAPAIPLTVRAVGEGVAIDVGAGAGGGRLWLVGFDAEHVTSVRGGENGGRTLRQINVVRALDAAGAWDGQAASRVAPRPAGERVAALLQAADGRILAAAVLGSP